MITLDRLTFSYPKTTRPALDALSGHIGEGIHLLVGENGAGKTTLLKVIAGILSPQEGDCLLDGTPASTDSPARMGRTFFLEENMYFPGKTIREFAAAHSPFYPGFSNEIFCRNLQALGLTGDEALKNASLGNRKKAQLAYVLSLGVEYLLLDEPTNALDIQAKQALQHILASETEAGQTIIVSTHTISELEYLYDGIIMLSHGKMVLAATDAEIAERISFTSSATPEEDAIYTEQNFGRYLSILPADIADGDTRTDWRRLYLALNSPCRDRLLELFADRTAPAETAAESNGDLGEDTDHSAPAGGKFSWKRVRDFARWNMLKLHGQLIWFPIISLLMAICLLLPCSETIQIGLFSLIWSVIPLLAELSPIVFARGGDARTIMRMIPATPAEKLTFYFIYTLVVVPASLLLLPFAASLLYLCIPAIQHPEMLKLYNLRNELSLTMNYNIPYLNVVLSNGAVILTCFYFVMRSRTNRIINGIISVLCVLFVSGVIGAVYSLTAVFRMGVIDGMSGVPQKTEEEILNSLINEMTVPYGMMWVLTILGFLFFAVMVWLTCRLFSHKSNRF